MYTLSFCRIHRCRIQIVMKDALSNAEYGNGIILEGIIWLSSPMHAARVTLIFNFWFKAWVETFPGPGNLIDKVWNTTTLCTRFPRRGESGRPFLAVDINNTKVHLAVPVLEPRQFRVSPTPLFHTCSHMRLGSQNDLRYKRYRIRMEAIISLCLN